MAGFPVLAGADAPLQGKTAKRNWQFHAGQARVTAAA
jgi:hypothetical protein